MCNARNATIRGGEKRTDYPDNHLSWYVILAENVHSVGIFSTGSGAVIDGQAEKCDLCIFLYCIISRVKFASKKKHFQVCGRTK